MANDPVDRVQYRTTPTAGPDEPKDTLSCDEMIVIAAQIRYAASKRPDEDDLDILESKIGHYSEKQQMAIMALAYCRERYSSRKNDNGGNVIYVAGGDLNMGDKYVNKGVAGVVGRVEGDAKFDGATLSQGAVNSQPTERLSQEQAAIVVTLAEALASQQIDGISLKERLNGAQHLTALAETSESGESPDNALARWTGWLESLGARANNVIALLATIHTVATPIKRLLGFEE